MPTLELAASFLIDVAKKSALEWAEKQGKEIVDGLVDDANYLPGLHLLGKRLAVMNRRIILPKECLPD